ncbi:MAG: putative polymerase sigma factor for flagellar regulon FliA [Microvirga sp.]|nr:putative polymerase sigma factor for flagellar regulon FliA [Microvirga sp.]
MEASLWKDWMSGRGAAIRVALFFFYAEWSRLVAASIQVRYPHPLAERQDYVHFASIGLLTAIDRFDPSLNTRFQSYAEPYIKGAILKGLSCYVRDSQKRDSATGVAGEEWTADAADGSSFDEVVNATIGLAFGCFLELGVLDVEPVSNNPLDIYSSNQQFEALDYYVQKLPERERQLILAHYYQQLSFTEIGELLQVSKPRVTQLHQQALRRIREWYEEDNEGF